MADLAAALIMGTALLGLIYWYFRASDDSRPHTPAPAPVRGGSATSSLPSGRADGAASDGPKTDDIPAGRVRASSETPLGGRGDRASWTDGGRLTKSASQPDDEEDDSGNDDDDLTLITLTPPEVLLMPITRPSTPSYGGEEEDEHEEEEEEDERDREEPSAVPIIYDDDAAIDEPTSSSPLLLISAVGQTDTGQRRKKNEDCYLCLDEHYLFAVADGMGGHAGGEIASRLAVDTLARTFKEQSFTDSPYPDVPRRGSELAVAIQRANQAVYDRAHADRALTGMGTTVVSARFSPNKQRLYIGHVGDSRCYRFRDMELTQVTTDHTMGAAGITGPMANHLSRAIGIAPAVKVDLIIARPHPGDVYLLCSDGLSKMTSNEAIREILVSEPDPQKASRALIEKANAGGGRDNITVILVRVSDPKDLARFASRAH